METTFKKCGLKDFDLLKEIVPRTFYEAFNDQNAADNMDLYMKSAFNGDQIKSELLNKDSVFFLVYIEEKLAGYLKLNENSAQTELKDAMSLEVERIYVLAAFQRKGIGEKMLCKAIEIGKLKNKKQLWLGVWEENKEAIRFYQNNGFEVFGRHEFMLGTELQFDLLMKRML